MGNGRNGRRFIVAVTFLAALPLALLLSLAENKAASLETAAARQLRSGSAAVRVAKAMARDGLYERRAADGSAVLVRGRKARP